MQTKEQKARSNAAYCASHKQQIAEYSREYHKDYRKTLKVRYGACRGRARRAGLFFDLSFEEYSSLLAPGVCHYCSEPLAKSGSGLDRKKSSLGYSADNCVPCCRACNLIRGYDLISYEEMLQVAQLLNRLRGK